MSKLSFRARALDASKPLPVFRCEDLPDLAEYASINRAVPQMPTGMEKEEESVRETPPPLGRVPPSPPHPGPHLRLCASTKWPPSSPRSPRPPGGGGDTRGGKAPSPAVPHRALPRSSLTALSPPARAPRPPAAPPRGPERHKGGHVTPRGGRHFVCRSLGRAWCGSRQERPGPGGGAVRSLRRPGALLSRTEPRGARVGGSARGPGRPQRSGAERGPPGPLCAFSLFPARRREWKGVCLGSSENPASAFRQARCNESCGGPHESQF